MATRDLIPIKDPKPVSIPPGPMPAMVGEEGSRFRRAVAYFTEAVVALGLALVFFGIFLSLLNVFFPTGIQLRELVTTNGSGVIEAPIPMAIAEVARLTVLRNDVRSRAAGGMAWGSAATRLGLHDRDAIQTLSNGRGVVKFGDGDEVHLEKNSLMIVNAQETRGGGRSGAAPDTPDAPAGGVVMVDGEIWGKLTLEADEKMNVMLPGGDIHLTAGTQSGAEFRVMVKRDKSSTIALYRGEASVSAMGKTVKLGANQGTRLTAAGELAAARDLVSAPRLLTPGSGTEMRYGDFPPQVLFQWSKVPNAENYRIVVARDREMRDVMIDRTVDRTDFLAGRLRGGSYYWRVSSVREELEGAPSTWSTMRTTHFAEPPTLVVAEIPKAVESTELRLTGRTRPGSRVIIAGQTVQVAANGTFEHLVTLEPGANVLTVESSDGEGNASYWTRVVHVKS